MKFPLIDRLQNRMSRPETSPAPARTLPADTPVHVRQAWERQEVAARIVLERLRAGDAVRPARKGAVGASDRSVASRVPSPRGEFARVGALDASRVFADVLVQDVSRDPMTTGVAYLQEGVLRVVDLRSETERRDQPSCFEASPLVKGSDFAEFEALRLGHPSSGDPVDQATDEAPAPIAQRAPGDQPPPRPGLYALSGDGREAFALRVSLGGRGPRVNETGELTLAASGVQGDPSPRVCRWALPLESQAAIRPDVLRALMAELASGGIGGKVSFMSPQGDRRAAVCAAALRLHRRFHRDDLERHRLEETVMDVCRRVRSACGPDRLDDAADIATLLAFGDLMLLLDRPSSREQATPPARRPRVRFQDQPASVAGAGSDIASSR